MESGGELIRGNDERVYVSVRVRPLNAKEISGNDVSDWECINDKTIVYKNVGLLASERSMYPTAYAFDRVFRTDCSTREVYEQGAKDVAISVVSGINSSIFAYGQTSSGKTYTMTGTTEYAIADIYEHVQKHPERNYTLKFSAMEIYNESVRDLLSEDSSPLRLLDDPERGTIVEKLTEEILRDWNHVTQLLSICEAQRQIGETSLNETSSRSHQIIRLTVESSSREFLGRDNLSTLAATVNFVDLAGSERASQSLSAGTRLKEGCHINRSLLTLGTVVRKLSKGQHGHIPYRDSKLTRILQTSLGGNARTAIICTMSPARSHVEQSRNTLHFASCAKEITTNAKVNVVMSDKALVKYLQRELARLESELRNPESNFIPSNFSELLREKDLQIEKLEKEIKDLILQRDIAQSQARDLLQMLGDDASSMVQGGLGHYPHLRVQKSPEAEIPKQDTSILANQDVDTRLCPDGHSRTSSEDHLPKVPFFDEYFVKNASPRVLLSSSSSACESDSSCSGWAEIDKLSGGTSEDLCREVHCIESELPSNRGIRVSNHLSYDETTELNGDGQDIELASQSPLAEAQEFISSQPKDDNEIKNDIAKELAVVESKEPSFPIFEEERQFKSTDYLDIPSLEKLSVSHDHEDPFGVKSSKFIRSKSCKASIVADSSSPWFKMMKRSENTPSLASEKECEGFQREIYPFNLGSSVERSPRKEECESPPEDAVDIEVDTTPDVKLTVEDNICSTSEVKDKDKLPIEPEITENPEKEIQTKADESPKKNAKDVGLDPIEDEFRGLSSWPVEFKRLQKEILELWHACNVSLVHRTYFFLLFQGDTSDAIYLEVEIRRIKFLKDKFDRGEETVVNGKRLTLASSAKALRQERRKLSEQMMKKFSEKEREGLFVKWGIGLKTKNRRLQLANRLWSNTEDMNHIDESAFLVAKLVGFIEPGQAPNKEMFGLNFAPRSSSRISTFKRSLVSLL